MTSAPRRRRLLCAAALALLPGARPAPAQQRTAPAGAAPASIALSPGVVVAPGRNTVFVMADPRGVEAIDARSGRVLWTSQEASIPLLVHGGRLLAMSEAAATTATGRRGLRLVLLDAARGTLVRALPAPELADWVIPDVAEGPGRSFTIGARARGDTAVVVWRARTSPVGGAYRPNAPPPRVAGDSVAFDLASGRRLARVGRPAAPAPSTVVLLTQPTLEGIRIALRHSRGKAPPSETTLATGPMGQVEGRFSADRRHVLVVRQLSGPRGFARYELTAFTADRGERVGQAVQTDVPGAFAVSGRRLLGFFWSMTPAVATAAGSPARLRALDLGPGTVAFDRPVRNVRYAGPMPP